MIKKLLALLVIFSLTFSSCVKEVSEPIEPSVLKKLKLIPLDPINVIYLNLKTIKRTRLGKELLKNELKFTYENKKTIFDSLGIDFNKDVDEIIFATQWNDINTFIITLNKHVDFDTNKIVTSNLAYYFPQDRILVFSNDEHKIEKIKAEDFELSFTKNPLFRRMINSIHYKEQFWFVTRNTGAFLRLLKENNSKNEKLENLFQSINFINFSLKLDKDISINSHWECVDEYRANLLKSVLNGIISVVSLTEPNDPFVRELAKSEIYTENKGVEVFIKIPGNKLQEIKQSIIANKLKRLTEYER